MIPEVIPIRWYPKLPDAARVEIPEWRFRDYPGIAGFVITREVASGFPWTQVEGVTYMINVADKDGNRLEDVDQPRATLEQSILVARNSYHIPPAEWVEMGHSRFEPFLEAEVESGSRYGFDHSFVANDFEEWEEMFGRSLSQVRVELARLKFHPNPDAVFIRTFDALGFEVIEWDCPTLDKAYAYAFEHFKVKREDWKPVPPGTSRGESGPSSAGGSPWGRLARPGSDLGSHRRTESGSTPVRWYPGIPDAARPLIPEWRGKHIPTDAGFIIKRVVPPPAPAGVSPIYYILCLADRERNELEDVDGSRETLEQAIAMARLAFHIPPAEWVELGDIRFEPFLEAAVRPGSLSKVEEHFAQQDAEGGRRLLGRSVRCVRVQLARMPNHPEPNTVCLRTFDAQGYEGPVWDCPTLENAYAFALRLFKVKLEEWKPASPEKPRDRFEASPPKIDPPEPAIQPEAGRETQAPMKPGIFPVRWCPKAPDAARSQIPFWRLKDYASVTGFLIARDISSVNYATVRRIFYLIFFADKDGNRLEAIGRDFDTIEQAVVYARTSFHVPPSEWEDIGQGRHMPLLEASLASGCPFGFSDYLDGHFSDISGWEALLGRSLSTVRVQLARLTNHPNPDGVCIRTFDAQGCEGASRDCPTLSEAYAHVHKHFHVKWKDWKPVPPETR